LCLHRQRNKDTPWSANDCRREADSAATGTASPTIETRRAQAFPLLGDDEIAHLRRFGKPRRFASGTRIYETGKPIPGMLVVLSGVVRILGRDGHGHEFPVVDHGRGNFAGEIGLLSGARSLVDAVAIGDVDALCDRLGTTACAVDREAALGEKITRAIILRRVALVETGTGGPVLVGAASSSDVVRLRNFLSRNVIPYALLDPGAIPKRGPLSRATRRAPKNCRSCFARTVLCCAIRPKRSSQKCIGMLDTSRHRPRLRRRDRGRGTRRAVDRRLCRFGRIVGARDRRALVRRPGGRQRAHRELSRIPDGISGAALAGRAYTQAQKFGASMLIPVEIVGLDCGVRPLAIRSAETRRRTPVRSRTVAVATGARYRRPDCANLNAMEGHGVWYWASPIEAKMCAGEEVVLVGGGNSAGQAAVFLAAHVAKVWMLVRGPGLAAKHVEVPDRSHRRHRQHRAAHAHVKSSGSPASASPASSP
jgi:thioredoxin reductase (NADPH)